MGLFSSVSYALNLYVQLSRGALTLDFGLNIHLNPLFNHVYVCVNSESSGKTAQVRKFALAFDACKCDHSFISGSFCVF